MSDRFDHTLERKLESKTDGAEGADTSVRRLELITGTGRRRHWSNEDKTRILLESLQPGANVSEVARRNGLSPQQLFGWRRDARALFDEGVGAGASGEVVVPGPPGPRPRGRPRKDRSESQFADAPVFAPVVVAAPPAALAAPTASAVRPTPPIPVVPPSAVAPLPGMIEIAIGGATVRIGSDVEAPLIAAVLGALRRPS